MTVKFQLKIVENVVRIMGTFLENYHDLWRIVYSAIQCVYVIHEIMITLI